MICVHFLSHILYIIVTITLLHSSSSKSVSSVVKKNNYTHYTEICEFPGGPCYFWSSSHGTVSTVKQRLAASEFQEQFKKYTLKGKLVLKCRYPCYHTDLAHFLHCSLYFHDMSHLGLAHCRRTSLRQL